MKRILSSCIGLVLATNISFVALSSDAGADAKLLSPVELTNDCQYAPANFVSKSYQTGSGDTINVLSLRKKHTHSVAVILRNIAAPGAPEVPRIEAVCLDRQKDASSVNGNIVFSGENGKRVPVVFRLVGFNTITWVQPAVKAIGILETAAPNSSDHPTAGDVPPCLGTPPPITATAKDLTVLMCKHTASHDLYYVYGLYMNQTGHAVPIEIDPQIIHQPS
jgi:hypothetical protein